jgi:hypothetical protein
MARFKPGQSGNPDGKPRGCKHASTRLREALAGDLPAIVAALVHKARDGDTSAAALIFSRVLPPLKPQSEPPDAPLTGASPMERAGAIATAAMSGDLSPTGASELMAVLAGQARIIDQTELIARLERIEAALRIEGVKK